MVAIGVDSQEEDLLLVAQEASIEVTTEVTGPCTQQFVQIVAKNAKFLLDLQMVNQYIVQTVLKKWEIEAIQGVPKEAILDLKIQDLIQTKLNLTP